MKIAFGRRNSQTNWQITKILRFPNDGFPLKEAVFVVAQLVVPLTLRRQIPTIIHQKIKSIESMNLIFYDSNLLSINPYSYGVYRQFAKIPVV